MKFDRRAFLASGAAAAACGPASTDEAAPYTVTQIAKYPKNPDAGCNNRRAKLYNECVAQRAIYALAEADARRSGKSLLVSFGAEWCIWCHVFDAYIDGKSGAFRYEFDGDRAVLTERRGDTVVQDAQALNAFVAEHFVVAHIESDNAPDGWSILEQTGAAAHFPDWVPFVFSVNREGAFAMTFTHEDVEVRRDGISDWYRGYDRRALLRVLQSMHAAAVG